MIIKRERVQVEPGQSGPTGHSVQIRNQTSTSGASRAPEASAAHGGSKQVRLLREEDVVRAVELTCSCGDVTVIELAYAEPIETESEEDPHE